MPIPDYQTVMLPLLRHASDKSDHTERETAEVLAGHFHLTDEERRQLLRSGARPTFHDRVHWAVSYLRQAELLENKRRGVFQITARGLQVLAQGPKRVDNQFLLRYPEFQAFMERRTTGRKSIPGEIGSENMPIVADSLTVAADIRTPSEIMEIQFQSLKLDLAQQLLELMHASSPSFFERLVVELLVKMGYGGSREDAGEVVGRSGDEGIDGLIKEDKLGLDTIYVQAKRWQGVVGRQDIQKFVGALHGQRARKGIFISTSSFTREAREYVTNIESKVVLIDGEQLAQLMIENDLGVSTVTNYAVKRVDSDYFTEA